MLLGLMLYHLTARNDLIITVASGLTGPASPCFFLSGLSNPAAVTKWGGGTLDWSILVVYS